MQIKAHSTRLFPVDQGADAYRLTGVASLCDWVLLTDSKKPQIVLRNCAETDRPKFIYVSLRDPFLALSVFTNQILPVLREPFVLITGSKDVTIPNQLDARFRRFNQEERGAIERILASPLMLHWFSENVDDPSMAKLSPLPIGLLWKDATADETIDVTESPPLLQRPTRVLCAHRVRNGAQWEPRRKVTSVAQTCWSDFTTVVTDEISESAYLRLVVDHAFVLCVHGGGLDPCPKLWQTLQYGAVPIIESNGVAGAYRQLPVAIVDKWSPDALTPEKLEAWQHELSPYFDEPSRRCQLLHKLSLDYWWTQILETREQALARL
jgi:hypothetical protein